MDNSSGLPLGMAKPLVGSLDTYITSTGSPDRSNILKSNQTCMLGHSKKVSKSDTSE